MGAPGGGKGNDLWILGGVGLPKWLSGKEPICQCRRQRRCRFDPWAGKIPWRRAWWPTPVFLSGESRGQRSLVDYSPWGHKELDTTERLSRSERVRSVMWSVNHAYAMKSKFMFIESVLPSNHLILCCLLLFLPSIFPSIRVFSNELALCIKWPKYWSFSFSTSTCNEYSFRIEWFNLLAVKGTFKSFLQNHISKASILWCSALFMVQLSHPYITMERP